MGELALNDRDLDAVIEECLNLGMTPDEIRDKLPGRYGEEWVNAEILARRDDIIFDFARIRERSRTRSVERVLTPGDARIQSEIRIAKIRIPTDDGSWVSIRYADATAEDLRRRASFDRGIAAGVLRHAIWCETCAELIEAQGVKKLGQVKGALPAVPTLEDVRELIAS